MGKIGICEFTKVTWDEFYERYTTDFLMDDTPYVYEREKVVKSFETRMNDSSRKYFAIFNDNVIIGQVYLKRFNLENKSAELGIALINDSVKDHGFGTQAIRLLLDYAFNTMKLNVIFADSVIRNVRSQHVLEKIGFKKTHQDSKFFYYKFEKF